MSNKWWNLFDDSRENGWASIKGRLFEFEGSIDFMEGSIVYFVEQIVKFVRGL